MNDNTSDAGDHVPAPQTLPAEAQETTVQDSAVTVDLPDAEPETSVKESVKSVILTRDSSLRQKITYVIGQIKGNSQVTLRALGQNVHKAITIASIVRERVGNVHQTTKLCHLEDPKANRKTSGVEISLSL